VPITQAATSDGDALVGGDEVGVFAGLVGGVAAWGVVVEADGATEADVVVGTVPVPECATDVGGVVGCGAVVGRAVVGGAVVGGAVVGVAGGGAAVVGAPVVGAPVVGAAVGDVVGADVVGAAVGGADVVGAAVGGADVVGGTAEVGGVELTGADGDVAVGGPDGGALVVPTVGLTPGVAPRNGFGTGPPGTSTSPWVPAGRSNDTPVSRLTMVN
jgi:hypothetical protein